MAITLTTKACGLILVCSALAPAQRSRAQPDIFLVTIDTLRADHVHCYGDEHIQTPALDGLAQDGIRFARAFTASPLTTPSHASILTGLLPSSHGVTDFGMPLWSGHPTWAQLLKERGYQTAAFIGAVVLDSNALAPGLDQGFDFYDHFSQPATDKSRWGRLERRAMDVASRAESWLSAHPKGAHFIWLHLYDPHDPYEPPPPFSETYKDSLYDGEIAYADSAVQHFIRFLKQRALYAHALIVVVGDHGEGLGEHGEDTHGIFLYDSTTHVPLILKLPAGKIAPRVVGAQVRTVDILPTVLELAQVAAPENLDGQSLTPYFAGDARAGRMLLAETDYPSDFGWAPLRSARTEESKFIEAPRPEFYDLRQDPAEAQNKYEPWNPVVQEARAALARVRAKAAPANKPAGAVGSQTIAELRALGYLGRADVGSSSNVPEPSLLPDPKDHIHEQNLIHRAMVASEAGRAAEAREALETLVQLAPSSYIGLRQLGELDLESGRYSEAAALFQRGNAARPADPAMELDLGKALEKTHDLPAAREALESSLKLLPGQPDARLLLGQVYLELSDYNSAIDQFEAAALLQPGKSDAKLWLARAYISSSKSADALKELTALEKIDSKNPELYRLLAEVYQSLGRRVEEQQAKERYEMLRKR